MILPSHTFGQVPVLPGEVLYLLRGIDQGGLQVLRQRLGQVHQSQPTLGRLAVEINRTGS